MSILKTFAIFAKFWEPGKVKTRLAKSIGNSLASEIYREFLVTSMSLAAELDGAKTIGFSPESAKNDFQAFASDWNLIPQANSDLGTRMQTFFDQVLSESREPADSSAELDHRVVLIGSDSPLLNPAWIEEAFEQLAEHDVVLGPSVDGGYYLVGARNQTPNIFQNIEWSTDQVFRQTISQLEQQNVSYTLLTPHRDIDNLEDLQWMCQELKTASHCPGNHAKLLELANQALKAAENREAL